MDARIGAQVGNRVRIDEHIGSGAVGNVYRGTQLALGRPVAVKFVDAEFAERTRREATLAARLSHPNIAHVVDAGTDADGAAFVVLELVDGPTLRQALADGTLSHAERLEILAQVADALEHTRRSGLIHTDITPSNVLLERRTTGWRAKVVDFGLAVEVGAPARDGVLGTPAYLAPEQARQLSLTAASDVYALGVIAFESFEGALPFASPTPLAALANKLTQPLPAIRAPGLSTEAANHFASVVTRALRRDPVERPAAGDFAAALRLIASLERQHAIATAALEASGASGPTLDGAVAAKASASSARSLLSDTPDATAVPARTAPQLSRNGAIGIGAAFVLASLTTAFVGVSLLGAGPAPEETSAATNPPAISAPAVAGTALSVPPSPDGAALSLQAALGAASEVTTDATSAARHAMQTQRAVHAAQAANTIAVRAARDASETRAEELRQARAESRRNRTARERAPDPEVIAQGQADLARARAAHGQGNLAEAVTLYERYLATAPAGEERNRIQRIVQRIRD